MDREKLAKLLAMTTSDNDHEALAALRMANKMLTAERATWGEVLAAGGASVRITLQREPYQPEENWQPPHLRDKVIIDQMFRVVYAQPRTGNEELWQFIDSVHQWWQDKQFLTPRQYAAIRAIVTRVRP